MHLKTSKKRRVYNMKKNKVLPSGCKECKRYHQLPTIDVHAETKPKEKGRKTLKINHVMY